MQKETIEQGAGPSADGFDEELRDVLIAISVVAKRLARKLEEEHQTKEGESQNEQE